METSKRYTSHRKWVEKNMEKYIAYHRAYNAREDVKKRRRDIYRKNIEHFKKRDRIHYYKTRDRHRELYMAKRYNISVEDYRNLFIKFDNRCGICRKTGQAKGKVLSVDHDHKTGKVRGLLCGNCNKGLGFLKDDLSLVNKIKEYLENHYDSLR